MAPIVRRVESDKIPEFLDIPRSQIEKFWSDWPLWRLVEKNVPAFIAAMNVPKALLETMFFLDGFYEKMMNQKLKEDIKKKGNKQ